MREPAFWWGAPGPAAALLAPIAALYGAVAGYRLRQAGHDCGLPVLCVGNFTAGGAGKTPTALAVGALLQAAGAKPFFLSRGYGGRLRGPARVDPGLHRARDVGDEPLLLARLYPTIVARDRVAGAALARAEGAGVIVMDDGFQNPSLQKDCALLVVDAARGVGNGRVIPAGPLRAPLAPQLGRADALLVIGAGRNAGTVIARAGAIPVFRGVLVPDPQALALLQAARLSAFAGIGDPQKFFATLTAAGLDVAARHAFPDHHVYSAEEAAALLAQARRAGFTLVTTEKDLARMAGIEALGMLARQARALPVTLVLDDAEGFARFVREKMGL
jgi:tetraacyldisaccharide 4'-kinase